MCVCVIFVMLLYDFRICSYGCLAFFVIFLRLSCERLNLRVRCVGALSFDVCASSMVSVRVSVSFSSCESFSLCIALYMCVHVSAVVICRHTEVVIVVVLIFGVECVKVAMSLKHVYVYVCMYTGMYVCVCM